VSRGADKLRGSRARRRIGRHQAEKDLRAYAYAGAAQENEEEVDGGEVTHAESDRNAGEVGDAKTDGYPGKISLTKEEKNLRESDSFRDALSESLCFSQKEKVFAESFTGIFSDAVEQEKETQIVADSFPVAG